MISPDLLPGYLPLARERLAVLVAAAEEEITVRRQRAIAARMGMPEPTFLAQWEAPFRASGEFCRQVALDLWRYNSGLPRRVTEAARRVIEAEHECRTAAIDGHWREQVSGWSLGAAEDAVGFSQRIARLELALLGHLAATPLLRSVLEWIAEDVAIETEYPVPPLLQHVAVSHAYAAGHLPAPRTAAESNSPWMDSVFVLTLALREMPSTISAFLAKNSLAEADPTVGPPFVEMESALHEMAAAEPEWRPLVDALSDGFDQLDAADFAAQQDQSPAPIAEDTTETVLDVEPEEAIELPTYLAARREALQRRFQARDPLVLSGLQRQAAARGIPMRTLRRELVEEAMVLAWAQRSAPWTPRVDSRRAPIIPSTDLDDAEFVRWFDREALRAAALLAQDLPYPLPRGYADHEHTLESEVGPCEDPYSGDTSDEYNSILDIVANDGEDERWAEAFERWEQAAMQRADDLVVAYALMTPGQKRMVAAWFAGARSWADAARMLGIAEGAVHTQLQRIRAKLDPPVPVRGEPPPGRGAEEHAA